MLRVRVLIIMQESKENFKPHSYKKKKKNSSDNL